MVVGGNGDGRSWLVVVVVVAIGSRSDPSVPVAADLGMPSSEESIKALMVRAALVFGG